MTIRLQPHLQLVGPGGARVQTTAKRYRIALNRAAAASARGAESFAVDYVSAGAIPQEANVWLHVYEVDCYHSQDRHTRFQFSEREAGSTENDLLATIPGCIVELSSPHRYEFRRVGDTPLTVHDAPEEHGWINLEVANADGEVELLGIPIAGADANEIVLEIGLVLSTTAAPPDEFRTHDWRDLSVTFVQNLHRALHLMVQGGGIHCAFYLASDGANAEFPRTAEAFAQRVGSLTLSDWTGFPGAPRGELVVGATPFAELNARHRFGTKPTLLEIPQALEAIRAKALEIAPNVMSSPATADDFFVKRLAIYTHGAPDGLNYHDETTASESGTRAPPSEQSHPWLRLSHAAFPDWVDGIKRNLARPRSDRAISEPGPIVGLFSCSTGLDPLQHRGYWHEHGAHLGPGSFGLVPFEGRWTGCQSIAETLCRAIAGAHWSERPVIEHGQAFPRTPPTRAEPLVPASNGDDCERVTVWAHATSGHVTFNPNVVCFTEAATWEGWMWLPADGVGFPTARPPIGCDATESRTDGRPHRFIQVMRDRWIELEQLMVAHTGDAAAILAPCFGGEAPADGTTRTESPVRARRAHGASTSGGT